MTRVLFSALVIVFLASCTKKEYTKFGEIEYVRYGEVCEAGDERHWLVDLVAKDAKDSTYLNTKALKRKVEIPVDKLDTFSNLVTLLSETCKGDSIELRLTAKEFYSSLNGTVPAYLKDEEVIDIQLFMRDKLNVIEYVTYKKVFESNLMRAYVEKNRWNAKLDTVTQVYVEKLKNNESGSEQFNSALISYSISTLGEKVIAFSRKDSPLNYEKNNSGLLPGIHYLMTQLSEGESLRAIIPSDLAFGAEGSNLVAPYSPLLIEIEVLEIFE